jgi:hypothetical protein
MIPTNNPKSTSSNKTDRNVAIHDNYFIEDDRKKLIF